VKIMVHFNWALVVAGLLFLLGLWGCMAIYNATLMNAAPFYFVGRQFFWLLLGLVLLVGCARVPFRWYRSQMKFLAPVMFLFLITVLPLGIQVNGMRGWYSLGHFMIQPSELAKPFFLLTLCLWGGHFGDGLKRFGTMLGITLVWLVPVILQPDFGTATVYLAGFLIVYWLSGGVFWPLAGLAAALVPGVIYLLATRPYIMRRFEGFLTPLADPGGSGWHVLQFQYTLARGGFSGMSWGKAVWANCYLPLPHSDSVFASITESLGVAGAMPIIFIFGLLVFAFVKLALLTENRERRIYVAAFGCLVAVQALLHISVNVTIFPPTGLTLPILSYGGSSLIATMIGAGIALSAAKPESEPKP
jgi:cell division protein FtsW